MKPITINSAVEFLIALLVAASVIAIVAKRFRLPYTVALVVGGLMLSWIRLPHLSPLMPGQRPDWLTPDIILFLVCRGHQYEHTEQYGPRVVHTMFYANEVPPRSRLGVEHRIQQ